MRSEWPDMRQANYVRDPNERAAIQEFFPVDLLRDAGLGFRSPVLKAALGLEVEALFLEYTGQGVHPHEPRFLLHLNRTIRVVPDPKDNKSKGGRSPPLYFRSCRLKMDTKTGQLCLEMRPESKFDEDGAILLVKHGSSTAWFQFGTLRGPDGGPRLLLSHLVYSLFGAEAPENVLHDLPELQCLPDLTWYGYTEMDNKNNSKRDVM